MEGRDENLNYISCSLLVQFDQLEILPFVYFVLKKGKRWSDDSKQFYLMICLWGKYLISGIIVTFMRVDVCLWLQCPAVESHLGKDLNWP